jgi:hypothetical protein
MDPRVSRIPKSETISTHVEMQYCRNRLFDLHFLGPHELSAAVADNDDDEAKWLLRTLKHVRDGYAPLKWIEKKLLGYDKSSRAKYYCERSRMWLQDFDAFTSGRILEEYSNIRDEHDSEAIETMNFYLDCSYAARLAALQVVVGLRPLLGRDVATLIGKLVYSTRSADWSREK